LQEPVDRRGGIVAAGSTTKQRKMPASAKQKMSAVFVWKIAEQLVRGVGLTRCCDIIHFCFNGHQRQARSGRLSLMLVNRSRCVDRLD
jgi:hypothetical protein